MIIAGVLWAALSETLRDIKGPLSLDHRINIFLLSVILVFLAILAFLFVFLSRRRRVSVSVSRKPAHEIAYEQLEALRRKDLIRQAKIKEYYTEISYIIRHYLENRFLLRAFEMTTEEFLFYVSDYAQPMHSASLSIGSERVQPLTGGMKGLISEHKTLLKEFLLACDLVKFAKYAPSTEETDAIFVSAKKFVDQTKEEVSLR